MTEKTRYVINTTVQEMNEYFEQRHREEKKSIGWFIWFEGSRERIFLGPEKPNLEIGDRVKISIEKIDETSHS